MNIAEFKQLVAERRFNEYPEYNTGSELVSQLLNYHEADANLKLHLAQTIFTRSFYGTYTVWYPDVVWYIRNFFEEYPGDKVKPWLSLTIKEAAGMILSEEHFTKGIIGTTFMFGVLEYYAKHHLGFRPLEPDKFAYVKQYEPKKRDLTIRSAFQHLQKNGLPIAKILNEIDAFTTNRLTGKGIPESERYPHKIADRLNRPRNPMLHGETHTFYETGAYLVMLYILFHLSDI